MFLLDYYIDYSDGIIINSISSYKNIMNKFIIKFIYDKKNNYLNNDELCLDAICYSKYYLYWKIYGCIYRDEIMNVLYDIEFIKSD